jgi:hypothetical protein
MNLPYQRERRLANHLGAANWRSRRGTPASPWRGVFFDGPRPDQGEDGEEVPVWVVFIGDEDAEPVGTVYRCRSFALGEGLARRMAKDRRLELIQEATIV